MTDWCMQCMHTDKCNRHETKFTSPTEFYGKWILLLIKDIVYTHICSLVAKLEQSSTCGLVWWLIQKEYDKHNFWWQLSWSIPKLEKECYNGLHMLKIEMLNWKKCGWRFQIMLLCFVQNTSNYSGTLLIWSLMSHENWTVLTGRGQSHFMTILLNCVVPENIHTYPTEGIFSKTPLPLWKFQ